MSPKFNQSKRRVAPRRNEGADKMRRRHSASAKRIACAQRLRAGVVIGVGDDVINSTERAIDRALDRLENFQGSVRAFLNEQIDCESQCLISLAQVCGRSMV
jgi:hypothetical protein